jgi:aspartyl protease family protein
MTDETRRFGKLLTILFWLASLGFLSFLFNGMLADRYNPNRHLLAGTASGERELVLQRNASGHYVAPGTINGHPVTFLLDTGATLVSVPAHLGSTLQLQPGGYQQVTTANGVVGARTTRIEHLGLGPFVFQDLRGHLNPGMQDDEILLGMVALKHLEFTQRGDRLILRHYVE